MDIQINGDIVEVNGVIKTINDSQELINAIKENSRTGKVIIRINDSFSLPSTVIGELLKLSDNGVSVSLEIRDNILYEMTDDLNLSKKLAIKQI